jgi:hypothetical protein
MNAASRLMAGVGFLVACAAAPGCSTLSPEGRLRARAAYDFSCPAEQLSVIQLYEFPISWNTMPRGVEGCGKKATYVFVNGNWVMNNLETRNGPTPVIAPERTRTEAKADAEYLVVPPLAHER